MKRFFSLLLCTAMLLSLIACNRSDPPPPDDGSVGGMTDVPDVDIPAPKLEFETLNVELAITGADTDSLMALGRELDELLEDALEDEGVEVDDIHVTFGTSSTATADALRSGSVQIAWLDAHSYIDHAGGITPVLGVETAGGCYLYAAPTDAGRALASKPTWDTVAQAAWGLQQEHSLLGYWYPMLYLADNYDGRTVDDLEDVSYFDSFDDALAAAEEGRVDLVAAKEPVTRDGFTLLAEFSPVFSGVVAVTGADAAIASEAFCQKLEAAVLALCETEPARGLLRACGQDACLAAGDEDFDALRRIFSLGY